MTQLTNWVTRENVHIYYNQTVIQMGDKGKLLNKRVANHSTFKCIQAFNIMPTLDLYLRSRVLVLYTTITKRATEEISFGKYW